MTKRVKVNSSNDDGRIKDQENWNELEKKVRDLQLTAEQGKEIDSQTVVQFNRSACLQARDSIGQTTVESLFRLAFLYGQPNPQDGIEVAFARVIPTLTETTMECFRRASVAEALPLRDSELNYALKGLLVLSAVTKALDSHREHMASSKKRKRDRNRSRKSAWVVIGETPHRCWRVLAAERGLVPVFLAAHQP